MRLPAAALAVLLLVAICSLAQADPRVSRSAGPLTDRMKGVCCITTISQPIPQPIPEPIPYKTILSALTGIKGVCCFSTTSRPIPHTMILSAYRTSKSCAMEAVVLVTRKGKEVCADPTAPWVQKYLQQFEFVDF